VAGIALRHIHLRFAWQACVWHWAGSGGALGPVLVVRDAAALCVAGMALGHTDLRFTQAWHFVTSTAVALCVAGVALGHIDLRFTWQAWHLETSTFVLRGRRATNGTGLALVALVAGTTLSHTHTIFHTPSLTHHLSHTTLSPTIFDTPSFTHNFVTHHL